MEKNKVYQELATYFSAYLNCLETGNTEWRDRHQERLETICENCLPHGSGFDCGTKLDLDRSENNRLVLTTSYHHMNSGGYYVGWTEHDIVITPSLQFGFDIDITLEDLDDDTLAEFADCYDGCDDSTEGCPDDCPHGLAEFGRANLESWLDYAHDTFNYCLNEPCKLD